MRLMNIINIALSHKRMRNFGTLLSILLTVLKKTCSDGGRTRDPRRGPRKRKKRHIVMRCMRKGSRCGTRTKRHTIKTGHESRPREGGSEGEESGPVGASCFRTCSCTFSLARVFEPRFRAFSRSALVLLIRKFYDNCYGISRK